MYMIKVVHAVQLIVATIDVHVNNRHLKIAGYTCRTEVQCMTLYTQDIVVPLPWHCKFMNPVTFKSII